MRAAAINHHNDTRGRLSKCAWLLTIGFILACATGCIPERPERPATQPMTQAHDVIYAALPATVRGRNGWADDLYSVFNALDLTPTPAHVCAVVAVAEQESSL